MKAQEEEDFWLISELGSHIWKVRTSHKQHTDHDHNYVAGFLLVITHLFSFILWRCVHATIEKLKNSNYSLLPQKHISIIVSSTWN